MECTLIFTTCSLKNRIAYFEFGGKFTMIIDLFINACILVTFITVYDNFFKNIIKSKSPLSKFVNAVCSSFLGCLLMIFSVRMTPTIITDFRVIPIILSAVLGGIIPSLITAIIMCFFRVLYFGMSNAAIVSIVATIVSALGFGVISNIKDTRKDKWIYSAIYSMLISTTAYIILIKDKAILLEFLIIYYIGFICVSFVIYKYTKYLRTLDEFYNKLKNEATIDFLTGINNVRQFDKAFNDYARQTVRKGEALSLLFLDIDHFKKVNDTYGHSSGDIILKDFASILSDTCRSFDIVSRNGGEEFSAILLDCSAIKAVEIAEKIRKRVENHKFSVSDRNLINITISIGVSAYPEVTDNVDNLLGYADNALYSAKRTGRNKVVLYKKD